MPWEKENMSFSGGGESEVEERRKSSREYYDDEVAVEDFVDAPLDPYQENLTDERARQEADKAIKRQVDAVLAEKEAREAREAAEKKDREYRRLAREYTRKIINEIESKDPSLRQQEDNKKDNKEGNRE
jgi:hypothetical protein